ncbi:hypothetical protein BDV96DRAFT_501211 [Lophiotrema nucula]|uniref:NB-ARC domain-containing protein n=1 Tax=Lophiotrema nucula TaxID=690887 RepID=A0A6A5YTA2_9PLEO|nr:hypothetical protein BDV96DRAFT_501211 [Lophiotrema nucula]
MKSQRSEIRRGFSSLQESSKSQFGRRDSVIQCAQSVLSIAFINEHFDTPQPVSSHYKGRTQELASLKIEVQRPYVTNQQKRFVVYGIGGSGKSQFCSKFAQENRNSFWGVFWIDAKTLKTAKDSFARIARMGKVEANENAAKAWLSSKDRPFLLIIDNADDPEIAVDQHFPQGEKAFILITTQNPQWRIHGNVSKKGFFHFKELESDAAQELLLRSAGEELPWSTMVYEVAAQICQTLGFLPLAIIQAGSAILSNFCTLHSYLKFFDQDWNRVREGQRQRRGSFTNITVYSSWEVAFKGLVAKQNQTSEDAVELLKTFSFLERVRIRMRDAKKQALAAKKKPGKRKSLGQTAKELLRTLVIAIMRLGEVPTLPKVLRDVDKRGRFNDYRLRQALKALVQLSLIDYDPVTDSYSMHQLLHKWVRERPEMSLKEQAVWCQAAGTVLAQALLLPPLGASQAAEDLRKDILPHVIHVHDQERDIQKKIEENQIDRTRSWPSLSTALARSQVAQRAKFSLVYAQNGYWKDALALQKDVAEFLYMSLGKDHPVTVRLSLLMADMHWAMSEPDNASMILEDLLHHVRASNGEDHEDTARVLDKLGATRWMQGRFKDARDLHRDVLAKFTKLYGTQHPETLKAMSNLDHGKMHTDTLMVMDNLAMTYFDRYYTSVGFGDRNDIDDAYEIITETVKGRRKVLGKEHGFTLWSMCNQARIKALRDDEGDIQEAERMIRSGLRIAERNLGETHLGTLYGKAQLGNVLMLAGKYEEAEHTLRGILVVYDESNKGHADQFVAMGYLTGCCQQLGKEAEAARLRERLIKGARSLFGEDSPWEDFFYRKYGR